MATITRELTQAPDAPAPARARNRRRPPLVALMTLAVVLCAELGARALAPHLPPIDDWNQREAAEEYAQMRVLSAHGGVDAVVLGSSVAHFGFEPGAFARITGMSAYDAALPGSSVRSMDAWARDFVVPMLHPKLVMIAVTSRDLNDNGPVQNDQLQKYVHSEARRRALGLGTPLERIERFFDDHSALIRLRRYFRRPAAVAKQLGGENALVRIVTLGSHGEARFPEANYPFTDDARRADWEREALQRFDMRRNLAALASLSAYLHARGIRVVLVDMPVVSSLYVAYHPHGSADYDAYRAALAASGLPVITVDGSAWSPQADFVDSIHLNRAGALRFSEILARNIGG